MKRSLLALVLLLGALAAVGQEKDFEIIGMRTVEGDELVRYRTLEQGLSCHFELLHGNHDIVAVTRGLLQQIASAGLSPQAENALVNEVVEKAFLAADDRLSLAGAFLDQPEAAFHEFAIAKLDEPDALDDAAFRARVAHLVERDDESDGTRAAAVWLMARRNAFDEVSGAALALASDHDRPQLAHFVAAAIVFRDEDDPQRLRELLFSDVRAIREEAALLGHRCAGDSLTGEMLLAVAKDNTEAERVRGDAIKALASCPESAVSRRAILELLDRRYWFYGAIGQHFPIHSLALIVPFLAAVPDLHDHLVALRPEVAKLPSGQREYVEWVLANALRAQPRSQ